MPEAQGIDAILTTVDAAEHLGVALAKVAKDGLQITDGATLLARLAVDTEFQAKAYRAYQLSKQVPAEAKDLDNKEKRQLTHRMVDVGFNIADELMA